MRRIAIAASVAAFSDFSLLIAGSKTPAFKLSRNSPSIKFKPTLPAREYNTVIHNLPAKVCTGVVRLCFVVDSTQVGDKFRCVHCSIHR